MQHAEMASPAPFLQRINATHEKLVSLVDATQRRVADQWSASKADIDRVLTHARRHMLTLLLEERRAITEWATTPASQQRAAVDPEDVPVGLRSPILQPYRKRVAFSLDEMEAHPRTPAHSSMQGRSWVQHSVLPPGLQTPQHHAGGMEMAILSAARALLVERLSTSMCASAHLGDAAESIAELTADLHAISLAIARLQRGADATSPDVPASEVQTPQAPRQHRVHAADAHLRKRELSPQSPDTLRGSATRDAEATPDMSTSSAESMLWHAPLTPVQLFSGVEEAPPAPMAVGLRDLLQAQDAASAKPMSVGRTADNADTAAIATRITNLLKAPGIPTARTEAVSVGALAWRHLVTPGPGDADASATGSSQPSSAQTADPVSAVEHRSEARSHAVVSTIATPEPAGVVRGFLFDDPAGFSPDPTHAMQQPQKATTQAGDAGDGSVGGETRDDDDDDDDPLNRSFERLLAKMHANAQARSEPQAPQQRVGTLPDNVRRVLSEAGCEDASSLIDELETATSMTAHASAVIVLPPRPAEVLGFEPSAAEDAISTSADAATLPASLPSCRLPDDSHEAATPIPDNAETTTTASVANLPSSVTPRLQQLEQPVSMVHGGVPAPSLQESIAQARLAIDALHELAEALHESVNASGSMSRGERSERESVAPAAEAEADGPSPRSGNDSDSAQSRQPQQVLSSEGLDREVDDTAATSEDTLHAPSSKPSTATSPTTMQAELEVESPASVSLITAHEEEQLSVSASSSSLENDETDPLAQAAALASGGNEGTESAHTMDAPVHQSAPFPSDSRTAGIQPSAHPHISSSTPPRSGSPAITMSPLEGEPSVWYVDDDHCGDTDVHPAAGSFALSSGSNSPTSLPSASTSPYTAAPSAMAPASDAGAQEGAHQSDLYVSLDEESARSLRGAASPATSLLDTTGNVARQLFMDTDSTPPRAIAMTPPRGPRESAVTAHQVAAMELVPPAFAQPNAAERPRTSRGSRHDTSELTRVDPSGDAFGGGLRRAGTTASASDENLCPFPAADLRPRTSRGRRDDLQPAYTGQRDSSDSDAQVAAVGGGSDHVGRLTQIAQSSWQRSTMPSAVAMRPATPPRARYSVPVRAVPVDPYVEMPSRIPCPVTATVTPRKHRSVLGVSMQQASAFPAADEIHEMVAGASPISVASPGELDSTLSTTPGRSPASASRPPFVAPSPERASAMRAEAAAADRRRARVDARIRRSQARAHRAAASPKVLGSPPAQSPASPKRKSTSSEHATAAHVPVAATAAAAASSPSTDSRGRGLLSRLRATAASASPSSDPVRTRGTVPEPRPAAGQGASVARAGESTVDRIGHSTAVSALSTLSETILPAASSPARGASTSVFGTSVGESVEMSPPTPTNTRTPSGTSPSPAESGGIAYRARRRIGVLSPLQPKRLSM